jgi:hypothetical protein
MQIFKSSVAILITLIATFLFETYFPDSFYSLTGKITNFFSISIDISLWLLVILIGTLSGLTLILSYLYLINNNKPKWITYTKDNFDEVTWEWSYHKSAPHDINENSIAAYCPNDQTPLVLERTPYSHNYTNRFHCETCSFISTEFTEEGSLLKAMISRRIIGQIRIKYLT